MRGYRDYNPPDPFSFGNTRQMQDRIKRDKEELRREKLKEELKDEHRRIETKSHRTPG